MTIRSAVYALKPENNMTDSRRIVGDSLSSANLKAGLTRVPSPSATFQKGLTSANLQTGLRPPSSPTPAPAPAPAPQDGARPAPGQGSK